MKDCGTQRWKEPLRICRVHGWKGGAVSPSPGLARYSHFLRRPSQLPAFNRLAFLENSGDVGHLGRQRGVPGVVRDIATDGRPVSQAEIAMNRQLWVGFCAR